MKRFLLLFALTASLLALIGPSYGQTQASGQTLITGAMGTEPVTPIAVAGDFTASLPLNWVDSHICDPPGGTYTEADSTLGTQTIAALQTAINLWAGGWYRIKIPHGWNAHGSTFDANGSLITFPIISNPTGCLVIESDTPLTANQIACSHGLPGYGGTRNPGCTNDIASMYSLTADSTSVSGNTILYAPYGSSHIVVRDANLQITAGGAQSASGVKVIIQADFECSVCGIERSYIHGHDPGDSGQPAGAATGWSRSTTVNTNVVNVGGVNHYPVSWVSGDRFGPDFSDGVHSPGYPQATVTINGTPYTILSGSHDPAQSDTLFEVANGPGAPLTNATLTMSNPATAYANGAGDDSRGIQLNCDNCWAEWNYFEKIHWYGSESHAISSGFSNGPVKIAHNWIEGGSAGYFSGGGPVDTRGGPANDIEIRGNFFGRDLGYRFLSASSGHSPHPPFGCGPLDNTASHNTCPFNWAIKNNLELKLGHRVLIDGNIIDGDWADGQSGYPILQTVRTCSGGTTCGIYDPASGVPLTAIDNVRFSNNWIRNSPQIIQISSRSLSPGNGGGMSQPIQNLDYINNVFTNVGDDNQWGSPGPDLAQWAASGEVFNATMTRSGCPNACVAHAVLSPMKIANFDPGTSNVGTFKNAWDISSMIRSGGVVTIKMNSARHDPRVGGQVTIANATGWNGTFTLTGSAQSGTTTACTTDLHGTSVNLAIAVGPQPCIRADGTFADTFTYADAQGADGTLCATLSACNALLIQATVDTHAYKIPDISVGDGLYVHNCTDTTYNTGASSSTLAIAPTVPTGLDVYYSNGTTNDATGTATCQVENSAGWPRGATFQYNTVIGSDIMSIGSNGLTSQHINNRFYHNIFAFPSGNNAVLACTGVGGQGTPVFSCWDQTTFNFYDNVIVDPAGTRAAQWSVVPSAAAANSFPASTSGFLTFTGSPLALCTFDGSDPKNCPLMALPWSSNFSLSQFLTSTQGAQIPAITDALTRTVYVCPNGANCGTTGPKAD